MRLAPNKIMQGKIKELVKAGVGADEISERLRIKLPAVKKWVDHFKKEKATASKKEATKE